VPENIAVKARIEELIDLTDEEAAALVRELRETVKSDRRPFSRRVVALRAILAKL
jgi:siroheme synthase (precorrin-2 oxidase/ferrochelatase)